MPASPGLIFGLFIVDFPPTEAVPIPGGVCAASSPGVAQACETSVAADLKDESFKYVSQNTAAALARLESSAKILENVQKIKQLVSDFELGIQVEAALLLLDAATLRDFLVEEAHIRLQLREKWASCRAAKVLWLVEMCDETVVDLLDAAVEVLTQKGA